MPKAPGATASHLFRRISTHAQDYLCRRGYIKGQHGYLAGVSIHAIPVTIIAQEEEDGWYMGWNSKHAEDTADLQPSHIGLMDSGGIPNDWIGGKYDDVGVTEITGH